MIAVLAMLFHASLHPDKVIFSNDGPLGVMNADSFAYPDILTGAWFDLNWVGNSGGTASPNVTAMLAMLLKPLYYAKFLAPISVLFLGFCAWVFFNRLGFSTGPAVLGGIAMALNSNIFSNVCWGLGSRALTVALFFLALAVIIPGGTRLIWARVILSGLCIGMAVMEGADNGVIFSFYLSAFILFQAWNQSGSPAGRIGKGVATVAVVAIFAGFIATQSIISLYGVAVKNVAGATANAEVVRSKAENWDWATQWSLPKTELLRVIIPGLYGYRLDTEKGGNYWGAVGRTPGWPGRPGMPRHSGAGEYAGVLVVLIAIWAFAQAIRKDSVYSPLERRWIWFWGIAAFVSILLAVGRYAPFYRVVYALPYFSAIRNPMKFMHPCHVSLVVLFAYGLQGMWRRYMVPATPSPAKPRTAVPVDQSWWRALPKFDKKWVIGSVVVLAVSLVGWMVYASSRADLEKHLMSVGFGEGTGNMAKQIAGFSLGEVGWSVVFLGLAVGAWVLIIKGTFTGARARLGFVVLGLLLVADLGRANRFWIIPVNYKLKYASNPLVDILRAKPYEQRTIMSIGFRLPQEYGSLQQYAHELYGIEWMQHVFPYYNVQALDVTQLSRKPEEYVQFEDRTFAFRGDTASARLQDRHWELTNTRYVIGLAAYEGPLNEVGPGKFRVHSRYELGLKPGIANFTSLEQLTVQPKPDGSIALFELTSALPRAKLYTQWQVSTNDQETLRKLADEGFDPSNTLLVSEPPASDQPSGTTNSVAGSVETTRYAPKRRELKANVSAPAVLLVNDRYDPDWKVRVDGHVEKLLRVNYLMRGVFLKPGQHTVTFSFEPAVRGLYVSLAGIGLGILLALVLLLASLRAKRANGA